MCSVTGCLLPIVSTLCSGFIFGVHWSSAGSSSLHHWPFIWCNCIRGIETLDEEHSVAECSVLEEWSSQLHRFESLKTQITKRQDVSTVCIKPTLVAGGSCCLFYHAGSYRYVAGSTCLNGWPETMAAPVYYSSISLPESTQNGPQVYSCPTTTTEGHWWHSVSISRRYINWLEWFL